MEPGVSASSSLSIVSGWTPPVRHSFVATLAVKWIVLLKPASFPQARNRLAKRRRALVEANPPRNSQPETHRDDGPGSRLRLASCFSNAYYRIESESQKKIAEH